MSQRKKAVKKQAAVKRAGERSLRRASRRNRDYLAWRHLTQDQKEVAQRIWAGDYQKIGPAGGWGFLDKFLIFIKTIGFLECLDIAGEGYVRRMITIAKLLLTYQVKILMGISSMNQVPGALFNDVGLLMLLGYTAEQVENGHCRRGKGKNNRPMNKNTLADALGRFSPEELEGILNGGVKLLAKQGFIKDTTFLMDATDLPTTEKCEGAGRRTVDKKVWSRKEKRLVTISETTFGFKLMLLRSLDSRIIVAAKVRQITESEKDWTLALVKQAEENIGEGRIKLLLIDRGYLDGLTLWTLKHVHVIDWIIPLRTDMAITQDARGLKNTVDAEKIFREERKDLEVVGFAGLTSYDQYGDEEHRKKSCASREFKGNPINAVMVTRWKDKVYEPGHEPVFLTTLAISKPLAILDKYDLRSLIENQTNRELKQGWLITKIPKKTQRAVTAHAILTLCMYNLTNAYRTELGQELTETGIRRFRRETYQQTHDKIVVFTEEHYGIFDLEEFAFLLGKPSKWFARHANAEAFKKAHGIT